MNDTPTTPNSSPTDELALLRALVEGTAHHTGEAFFQSLVRHLAAALRVDYAFIAEFTTPPSIRTLAYWFRDRFLEPVTWDLTGTPCEEVVRGHLCHHPTGTWQKFPADKPLAEWGIESYLGVPLLDAHGQHLGHLAVFDGRPMPPEPRQLMTFRIFAARAAAELERLRFERQLAESEQRYRDLFDEAPIAYVNEGLDSRFITANRTAQRILGLRPEEVPGTLGLSFVPNTPDAQRRVKEAFASIGRGTDTGGVLLELRRKDTGQPLWIQWWSRPDPGGQFTRTMFLDVTDRVLAEQEQARLRQQNLYLQEEIRATHQFDEIVGRGPALAAVLDQAGRVAATDATVLITGETGTGKELVARAIHAHSKRKDRPLIKVNCAALPAGLVESELFGHEKGAFTGALARRIGRFELAHGGTIFLDEIGELPADAQAKLLRVLQEREFERVGGGQAIKADVRVLAATNRDLLAAVRKRDFREDLYYRLSVFPLHLPPLRERKEDVPLLVQFYLAQFAQRIGKRVEGVSAATLQRLEAYPWPGNVRELQNVLERAVILATTPILEIGPDALPAAPPAPAAPTEPAEAAPPATLQSAERNHILAVLRQTNWVIEGPRGAAAVLGLHPNTLRSRMKKLGLRRGAHESS